MQVMFSFPCRMTASLESIPRNTVIPVYKGDDNLDFRSSWVHNGLGKRKWRVTLRGTSFGESNQCSIGAPLGLSLMHSLHIYTATPNNLANPQKTLK